MPGLPPPLPLLRLLFLVVSSGLLSAATALGGAAGVLATAKAVNDYALRRIVSAPNHPAEGRGCQWTRSAYMVGLAEYYAASESAHLPDSRARSFLVAWGEAFQYQLCRAGPCTGAFPYNP